MATVFGATTATAYALLGMNAPALASETPKVGGTSRIGMVVRAGKDPRSYDDSPQANISRGWLEYLVRYTHAFIFEPMLLESWGISEVCQARPREAARVRRTGDAPGKAMPNRPDRAAAGNIRTGPKRGFSAFHL